MLIRKAFMGSTLLFLSCVTGYAVAACNTNQDETNATYATEHGGQGNFTCNNLGMTDITSSSTVTGIGTSAIDFVSPEEVDTVIVSDSKGKRCLYFYPDQAVDGEQLTPDSKQAVSNVKICTDGKPGFSNQTSLPLPVSSVDNGCGGAITLPQGEQCPENDPGCNNPLVVAGFSKDGVSFCTGNAATTQKSCINRCVNKRDVVVGVEPCIPEPNGELPLECRVCDLSSENPSPEGGPYCWELTQRVCENTTDPGCTSRTYDKSFVTKAAVQDTTVTATQFDGSTCYLLGFVNGRAYYQCF